MIAVDTNVLARFFCDDPDDPEAKAQRPLARRLLLDADAVFVSLSVVLELEWVFRGFYRLQPHDFCAAIEHLIAMPQVVVERWEVVREAAALHLAGFDFADALHWAQAHDCTRLVTFDQKLVRKAKRANRSPPVSAP